MSPLYPTMMDHTFLLLPFTSETYQNPDPLLPIIFKTLTHSSESSLTVILSTPSQVGQQLYTILRQDPVTHWKRFQTFLGKIYATLAAAQWSCGRVLMEVEVRFVGEDGDWSKKLGKDKRDPKEMQTIQLEGVQAIQSTCGLGKQLPPTSVFLPNPYTEPMTSDTTSGNTSPLPVVALGGTFDHLHAAHKLLLHLALFLTSRKLIVGVMSDRLLTSKSNAPLVEDLATRIQGVKDFLNRCGTDCSSGAVSDVVEIEDPLGPTAWDNDIQALVVSQETFSGGGYVNRVRQEKGLGKLELYVIDVISSTLLGNIEEVDEEASTVKPDNLMEEDDEATVRARRHSQAEDEGRSSVQTLDLTHEFDEGKLKEMKLGSTAIRQWILDHRKGERDG